MSEINYKLKYQQLKMKYMNSVDTSFRLGYEAGMKDAQADALAQQAQQQAGVDPNNPEGMEGEEGQPGEEGQEGMEGEQGAEAAPVQGTELDQHIGQLESMVGGGKDVKPEEIKKSLEKIKAFKMASDMRTNMKAIKNIKKAMKPKFGLGKQAASNLNDNAKKALSMQESIVSDVMKSWEAEDARAKKDITKLLGVEGLVKKE